MEKYMLIINEEGYPEVIFTNDYNDAKRMKQDAECGMGYYAELYSREETRHGREYRLLEV